MDDFKVYLINTDHAPRTVIRHLRYVQKLLLHCPNLSIDQINTYFASLKERGLKNTYLNHLISTLRVYGEFKGLDYLKQIKYRKEEQFIKATMSDEEIEAFLSLPTPKGAFRKDWKMWTTFFSIMAFSGMRPGEVAHLEVEDCDFGLGVFHIRHGKTPASIGSLPIAPNILNLVKDYLSDLETTKLFPSQRGGNLDRGGVVVEANWHFRFHQRIKLLGIKRTNLSVYSFRHSYATHLADQDVNLYTIKTLMRHTDIKTTERYMHSSLKTMRNAMAKLPLIRRGTEPRFILSSLCELIKSFKIEDDSRFNYRIEENDNSLRFEVYIK